MTSNDGPHSSQCPAQRSLCRNGTLSFGSGRPGGGRCRAMSHRSCSSLTGAVLVAFVLLLPQLFSAANAQVVVRADINVLESAAPLECVYNISAPSGTVCMQPTGIVAFSVDNTRLCIQVASGQSLDFESNAPNPVSFQFVCGGSLVVLAVVTVVDVNDHVPVFSPTVVNVTIPEGSAPHTLIAGLHAADGDSGTLGQSSITYTLNPKSNINNIFQIVGSPGARQLVLRGTLDREGGHENYTLIVFATDGGGLRGHLIVYVTVADTNDNPPVFFQASYAASEREDLPLNTHILTVLAPDADTRTNAIVDYSIQQRMPDANGSLLAVDPSSGAVRSARKPLPLGVHTFLIFASDGKFKSNVTLTLTVLDINDIVPTVTRSCAHTLEYEEPGPGVGSVICTFTVTDADTGLNGVVNVSLLNGQGMFALDLAKPFLRQTPLTVPIRVIGMLDFENTTQYNLMLRVSDNGQPPQINTGNVTVYVNDSNESPPVFKPDGYTICVSEDAQKNEPLTRVTAFDPDGSSSAIMYSIVFASSFVALPWFRIDPVTGVLFTAGSPDREVLPSVNLTVEAADTGILLGRPTSLISQTIVQVVVKDTNDNAPAFFAVSYSGTVAESSRPGTLVTRVLATDPDLGSNGTVQYRMLNGAGSVSSEFMVNASGYISVATAAQLDRETHPQYNLTCVASDKGSPPMSSSVPVIITVLDVNDHTPVLYPLAYHCNILENLPAGQVCTTLSATDADIGLNSAVSYRIVSGDPQGNFTVGNSTGTLQSATPLDAEKQIIFSLQVQAIDGAGLVSLVNAVVNISVLNVRDHPPVFFYPIYSFPVSENASTSTVIGTVLASSEDASTNPGSIVYSIADGDPGNHFSIGRTTGEIAVALALDREVIDFYELTVAAEEVGSPPLYSSVTVNVSVEDVNDNAPFFGKASDTVNVLECHHINNPAIYTANATDQDFNRAGRVRYSLLNTSDSGFAIDRFSGEVTLTRPLDFETKPQETVIVKAADRGQIRLTSTITLIVQIQDCNDVAPTFTQDVYTGSVNESTPPLTPVLSVLAKDPDFGGNGSISYAVQQPGSVPFGVSPGSGLIYVRQQLDRENVSLYRFVVVASDGNQTNQTTVEIRITDTNDNPPVFSESVYMFYVMEDKYSVMSPVGSVLANDSDDGVNAGIRYKLLTNTTIFSIDAISGQVLVQAVLDRESQTKYTLQVLATDQGLPQLESTCMVNVIVTDANDNQPVFIQPPDRMKAVVSIDEDAGIGTTVFTVKAQDADSGINAQIAFYWDGAPSSLFSLNDSSGVISTIAPLDFEANQQFTLRINASDRGVPRLSSFAKVEVHVRDINDEPPVFVNTSGLTLSFVEDHPVNTELARLIAEDKESLANGNGVVRYRIIPQSPLIASMFSIDANSGTITLLKPFNRTAVDSYTLTVQAADVPGGTGMPLTANYTLKMRVLQDFDTGPYFPRPIQTVDVLEDTKPVADVLQIVAVDRDSGANGILTYTLLSQESDPNQGGSTSPKQYFAINNATGWITLQLPLDYESVRKFDLVIQATDFSANRRSANASLTVQVKNVNEDSPVFPPSQNFSLDEDERLDQPVYIATAQDQDDGVFGQVVYAFHLQDGSLALRDGPFSINATTGEVRLYSNLDYENIRFYSLRIRGTDTLGSPTGRFSELVLNITVQDVNDNPPVFAYARYMVEIDENLPSGTSVVTVRATDRDSGSNNVITYFLPPGEGMGKFRVGAMNGVVRTTIPLDRDSGIDRYSFSIIASDSGNPSLTSKVNVNVNVRDINDCTPNFIRPPSSYTVQENLRMSTIDTLLVFDCDEGPNARVSYSIISGNDGGQFAISPRGGLLVVPQPLDRENQTFYRLTIQVCDSPVNKNNTMCNTVVVNITVLDDNDNSPVFNQTQYGGAVPEDAGIGVSVLKVEATDADSTFGTVHYEMTDPTGRFVIDRSTGVIRVAMALDHEDQFSYSLTVDAVDNDPHGARRTYTTVNIAILDVNDFTPTFTKTEYNVNVSTAIAVSGSVFNMTAFDIDSEENGRISYSFATLTLDFSINPISGLVSTVRQLTVAQSPYVLDVVATDSGSPSRNSSANLSVAVLPANQAPPRFLEDLKVVLYRFGNVMVNDRITQVDAITDNASVVLNYGISSVTPSDFTTYFRVDTLYGIVTAVKAATLSANSRIRIEISASSSAQARLVATTTVQLQRDLLQHTFLFFVSASAVRISESVPVGTPVITVVAKSELQQSVPRYSIVAGNTGKTFLMDANTGVMRTSKALDFETTPSYTVSVMAVDAANFSRAAISKIQIDVGNTNDNPLVWHALPTGPIIISESLPPRSYIGRVQAIDPDNFPLLYRIENQPVTIFNISQNGDISLGTMGVDFEAKSIYLLRVTCSDGSQTISGNVTVVVTDTNDNPPSFFPTTLRKTIPENAGPGWPVDKVTATDRDSGANSMVTYRLVNNINNSLTINSKTGDVALLKTIPYRSGSPNTHYVTIAATDHGIPPLNATVLLIIDIVDINDHPPVFNQPTYMFNVSEDTAVQMIVGEVQATDADSGKNSRLSYQIVNGSRFFSVDHNNGKIFLLRKLDRETAKYFSLNVSVSDDGQPKRVATARVDIYVLDENDSPPHFERAVYNVGVKESMSLSRVILTVSATDNDVGRNADITYRIIGEDHRVFQLDAQTGMLTLLRPLTTLTLAGVYSVQLTVEATDGAQEDTAKVNVVIFRSNQTDPVFTSLVYEKPVSEAAPIDQVIVQVQALLPLDPFSTTLRYFLADNATTDIRALFGVNVMDGYITLLAPGVLDYETRKSYVFFVKAIDERNAEFLSYAKVIVNVLNYNEYTPVFGKHSYTFSTVGGTVVRSTLLGTVQALDHDDTPVSFFFQASNSTTFGDNLLTIGRSSGAILAGDGLASYKQSKLTVIVVATDGHFDKSVNVTLEISGTGSGAAGSSGSSTSTILIVAVIIVVLLLVLVVVVVLLVVRKRSKHSKSLHRLDSQYGYAPTANAPAGRKDSSRALLGGSTSAAPGGGEPGGLDSPNIVNNTASSEEISLQRLSNGTNSTYIRSDPSLHPRYPHYGMPPAGAYPMMGHEQLQEFGEEGAGEAWGGLGGGGAMDMNTMIFSRLAEIEADEHEAIMDGVRAFNADNLSHAGSIGSVARFVDELCSHSDSTPNLRQLAKDLSALNTAGKKPMPSPRIAPKSTAPLTNGHDKVGSSEMSVVSPSWSSSQPSEQSDLIGHEAPVEDTLEDTLHMSMSDLGAPEEITLSPTSPSKGGYWSPTSNDQDGQNKQPQTTTLRRVEQEERQDALDKMICFGDDEEDERSVMTEDFMDEMRFSDCEAEEV